MLDPDDTLDPALAALYAAERAAPLPEGASARVLAGVLSATTAGTVATGVSVKAVLAIAIASAVGGGAIAVVGYQQLVEPATERAPAPVPTPTPLPDAIEAPVIILDAGVPVARDAAIAVTRPVDAAVVRPEAENRESLLVDRARVALRRGLIDEALTTLMRHERLHPAGSLAEERDVLLIEAYSAKGERALALRRIASYRRDHPDGFLRARVDAAEAALANDP